MRTRIGPPSPSYHYVSTAIGIHNSRHFGSLAACFLISADRAATPANLLDSFRETGVRGKVTVMSRSRLASLPTLHKDVSWTRVIVITTHTTRYAPLTYYEDVLEASRNTLMARNAREICNFFAHLYLHNG